VIAFLPCPCRWFLARAVKVSVAEVRVEHQVKPGDFTKWREKGRNLSHKAVRYRTVFRIAKSDSRVSKFREGSSWVPQI
jgi:hypothetical protein